MSKDGFDNEIKICSYLNNKKFLELNNNMKKLIKFIFPKIIDEGIIKCVKEGGAHKSDLLISFNKTKKRVSIKKGSGNSVHQEPVEDFIKHLEKEFSISDKLKEDLRFFIWGDYTLNGSGNKESRMSSSEIKKRFPEMIERLSNFMDLHKNKLIKRFVITGPKSNKEPDLIYYGTINEGFFCKSNRAIKLLNSSKSKSTIPIGKLTFQAWNRAIKKGSRSEHKRGVIQLKWPTIKKDLKSLMKNE